jgi:hypothetical protein
MTFWRSALVLVVAVALAGCGTDAANPGGPATGTGTGPLATATESPSTLPETDPTFVSGTRTLTGTVHQGAEPGCLFLQATEGQFELLSPVPVPHDGDHITVSGHDVKAMSHCMQGRPFLVEKLTIG